MQTESGEIKWPLRSKLLNALISLIGYDEHSHCFLYIFVVFRTRLVWSMLK